MRYTAILLITVAFAFGTTAIVAQDVTRLPSPFQAPDISGPPYVQLASVEYGVGPAAEKCEADCLGWYASAELLVMRANRQGLDFAIVDPDGDADVEGRVLSLDNELPWDAGLRATIGATLGLQDEIDFTYLHFTQGASAGVDEPPGGRIWIPIMPPDQTENYTRVDASYNVEINAYDVTYHRVLYVLGGAARLSGGVRIADVSQRFDVLGSIGGGGSNPEDSYNTKVDFSGAGPRIGFGFERNLIRNVSFFGSAYGSLMLGSFDTRVFLAEDANVEIDISAEYSQTVPIAEVELGLLWEPQFLHGFRFSFGWQQMNWFNMSPAQQFVDDGGQDQGTFVDLSHDLSLSAFFSRVEYRY